MPRLRTLLPWLVTLVALAVAATSLAPAVAAALTNAEKAQVKKIAKKQAAKAIKKSATTLTVAQADHAATATTADQAQIALSPVAYAVVDPDGVLVTSQGLTQANVTQRDVAAYCFDVPFQFKTVQTTPIYAGSAAPADAKVGIRGVLGVVQECLASEEVEIATSVSGAFAKTSFVIWFYN